MLQVIDESSLPEEFKNIICNETENKVLIRSNLKCMDDVNKWVQLFGKKTNTQWNSRTSCPEGTQIICSKKFVCHQSSFMKVPAKINKKGISKNANCLASILLRVKLDTICTRKRDTFVKKGLQGVILIENFHNHSLETAETVRFLQPHPEIRDMFFEYFKAQLTVSQAKKYHESLFEGNQNKELAMASGSKNPTYRTIQSWYKGWKNLNLGRKEIITEDEKNDIMGGWCAAVGCKNSNQKGYTMKYFPRDPKRRKKWLEKMARPDFVPSRNSVLCEMHFTPDMWENTREDGSKRLKVTAIPTVFEHKLLSEIAEEECIEILIEEDENTDSNDETPKRRKLLHSNEEFSDSETTLSNAEQIIEESKLIISKEKISDDQAALVAQNYSILLVPRETPLNPSKILQNKTLIKPVSLKPSSNGTFEITSPLPFSDITCSSDNKIGLKNTINSKNGILSCKRPLSIKEESTDAQQGTDSPKSSAESNREANSDSINDEIISDNNRANELTEETHFHVLSNSDAEEINGNSDSDEITLKTDEQSLSTDVLSNLSKQAIISKYVKKCSKLEEAVERYRTKMRLANRKIRRLECQVKENHHMQLLTRLFNEDQIAALEMIVSGKSVSQMKWSDDTIVKSLKLKAACGKKGYEEILSQGLPYPSIRTLQRAIAVPAEFTDTS